MSGPFQAENGSDMVGSGGSALGSREGGLKGDGESAPNWADCQSPMKPRVVLDADENVVRRD